MARSASARRSRLATQARDESRMNRWPCDWLMDHGYDEDGERVLRECGASSREVGAGWECEAGHRHLGIEAELAPFGPEWQRELAER